MIYCTCGGPGDRAGEMTAQSRFLGKSGAALLFLHGGICAEAAG
jgi:hypothetical protein